MPVVQEVDATLQVEQPDTTLAPLAVAADVASPTAVALPVLDAETREQLGLILARLLDTLTVDVSSAPGLAISEAIVATGYDLAAAAYTATSAIANDYILNAVTFQFSTAQRRTITITRPDGSKLWEDTSASLEIALEDIDEVFDGGDNFTIAVTQTTGACTVDISAKVSQGSVPLVGNPTVTQGTTPWVTATESPVQMRSMSRFYNIRGQRHIATTGYIQQTLNTSGEALALLKNPVGSGKVLLFDKAEFGATASTRFSRFGGGTTPLIGTPTPRPIGRTDGGTSSSVMELYTGGNSSPQFAISGGGFIAGTLRKVATMTAYASYQLLEMDGTVAMQPGQQAYWVVDEVPGGGAGNFHTFIDLEWVEIPTATWAAMVTALQSKLEY